MNRWLGRYDAPLQGSATMWSRSHQLWRSQQWALPLHLPQTPHTTSPPQCWSCTETARCNVRRRDRSLLGVKYQHDAELMVQARDGHAELAKQAGTAIASALVSLEAETGELVEQAGGASMEPDPRRCASCSRYRRMEPGPRRCTSRGWLFSSLRRCSWQPAFGAREARAMPSSCSSCGAEGAATSAYPTRRADGTSSLRSWRSLVRRHRRMVPDPRRCAS